MTEQGSTSQPELLTPREHEVLALLREGLTNPQIAERMSISLDGAKYHVSEILGKLGVSSREEAARWVASERPWWDTAAAPLAWSWRRANVSWLATAAGGITAIIVLAGIGLLVWGLVRTDGDPATGDSDDPPLISLELPTVSPEPRECLYCAPDLEMKVGDAVLRGTPGTMTYTTADLTVGRDAPADLTPAEPVVAQVGVDGLITLPPGFVGRLASVVVSQPGPSEDADCTALVPPSDEVAFWDGCRASLTVLTVREFDASPSASEFSLPLSELLPEPGEYVISLNAEITNGDEAWSGQFGFYLEAIDLPNLTEATE